MHTQKRNKLFNQQTHISNSIFLKIFQKYEFGFTVQNHGPETLDR